MIGDFTITFEFNLQRNHIRTPLESQYDLDELKHGFWLDQNRNLTREDRGRWWIPPSRIVLIERLQ